MSPRAKIYIAVMIAAAVVVLGFALSTSHVKDPARLAAYAFAALFAAGLTVTLPGITGALSVSYVFILIGIADLSLGEAVLIASLSTVLQSIWQAKKRPKPIQLLFNAAS